MSADDREPRGLPIKPGHVLFPVLALVALAGLLFGRAGDPDEDSTDGQTHPYFPDHYWPYPILAMASLVILGLLAAWVQQLLQLGPSADPRVALNPRPEWYLLSIFQFAKLGPALVTTILIPAVVVISLVFWPLVDARLGPSLARRFGWRTWPAPKHNRITGTIWVIVLWLIGLLTLWAAFFPQLCVPWFFNGPVCGG